MTEPALSPFIEAANRAGSHEGPVMLFDWYFTGRIPRTELAEAVPYVWSSAHLPFASLGGKTWIDLFQLAGYTVDGKAAEKPQLPLTLFRAAEPNYVHRLAWTSSLDVAHRFQEINAARYGKKPRHIYTVTITDPDRVLAYITDRGEEEYVVDTRGLRAQRLETADELDG